MKYRQYLTYLVTLFVAGLFSCANPTSPTTTKYTVTIKGLVVNLLATPLDSVRIVIWVPFTTDTAKSDGTFSLSFSSDEKSAVADSITFSRPGFFSTTKLFTYSSTSNTISLSAIPLKGVTSAQDSLTPGKPSQRAGQVVFVGSSTDALSILGAGGKDAAFLTFEVRDSLGIPVDTANQVNVNFAFINRPDLQTQLNRDSALTNSAGQVVVQLSSGLRSGIASVQASAIIKGAIKADTIKSQVVSIPIYGGFPDSAHFSIGSAKYNIPGGVIIGIEDNISVLVGDKYGNPVRPGTTIYFSSTGGLIAGTQTTDALGRASVTLLTGNVVPPNGIAWVKAQVATGQGGGIAPPVKSQLAAKGKPVIETAPVDDAVIPKPLSNHVVKQKISKVLAGPIISDSIPIMFSSWTTVGSPDDSFHIPVASSKVIRYTVGDIIGNPLTSGTTIKVSTLGAGASNVSVSGDVDYTMPDVQSQAYTHFQVTLSDKRTTGLSSSQSLYLVIDVTSQNSNSKLTLTGLLEGTGGVTVDSSVVSRIILLNPSPDSVVVSGVGGNKSTQITYKVLNTFGLPAKNVLVSFDFSKGLGGGEYISPQSALTDTGGIVKTTMTAGIAFGEVRVVASARRDSGSIVSDPKVVYIYIPFSARLASQIAYLGATASDIFVAGVGGLENSTISYEVRDSLGIPIDRQRRVNATYEVQFFPNSLVGGGTAPTVIPSSDSTDDVGRLKTSVVSGSEAGVIQIVVRIQLPGRPLLISQPVRISVHAGFPDQGHFSLIPSQWVFGGFRLRNDVKFTVVVGDTFSNPVQAGTAIYFHSQAGVIQTGQGAYTDVTGLATVSLNPVNPTPDVAGSNIAGRPTFDTTFDARIGGRIGYYWVVAQTQGANGKLVHDSVLVCQDEAPITVTGIPNSPVMVDSITGVSAPITIKVTDVHGNPLPNGSTISASITLPSNPPTGLAAAVLGDISTDFPREIPTYAEARFPARFITDFTFRVANTGSISHITVGVKITISAPDILETLTLSFPAYLQP